MCNGCEIFEKHCDGSTSIWMLKGVRHYKGLDILTE